MNLSLLSGITPCDWKIARVAPIYKGKGSKSDESNYRPISVIASVAMIIEREVSKQVMEYLIDHDLITVDQFAFLKNHSTVTSLHRLVDDWYEAFDAGDFVFACFLISRNALILSITAYYWKNY